MLETEGDERHDWHPQRRDLPRGGVRRLRLHDGDCHQPVRPDALDERSAGRQGGLPQRERRGFGSHHTTGGKNASCPNHAGDCQRACEVPKEGQAQHTSGRPGAFSRDWRQRLGEHVASEQLAARESDHRQAHWEHCTLDQRDRPWRHDVGAAASYDSHQQPTPGQHRPSQEAAGQDLTGGAQSLRDAFLDELVHRCVCAERSGRAAEHRGQGRLNREFSHHTTWQHQQLFLRTGAQPQRQGKLPDACSKHTLRQRAQAQHCALRCKQRMAPLPRGRRLGGGMKAP
mmetsp:Transcript_33237/g.91588  ORF Transcript_33237/g.91588 Transcript_33237/m.91588 type:complete len:286 (-) Transcript_33237:2-859(-)